MQKQNHLTVKRLFKTKKEYLELELLAGENGLENKILKPRVQRPGLALAGYMEKIDPQRVQVLGSTELDYLASLDKKKQARIITDLSKAGLCCFLITKGLDPPLELRIQSEKRKVPLLRSNLLSSVLIRRLMNYLEEELAEETSVHGDLLDIFGVGVLIMGRSGIGKSECALDLIARGHQLVSDDIVKIRLLPPDILLGTGYDLTRYHLEIRGVGIIDIKRIFGVASIREKKRLELAIMLDEWKEEYDRLGLDTYCTEFLGIKIPMVRMPVAPGRNLSIILEVAVRNYLLRKEGISPASEIDNKIKTRDPIKKGY